MGQSVLFKNPDELVGPWSKSHRAALHHTNGFGRQKARQAHDPDAKIPLRREGPAHANRKAEAELNVTFEQIHAVELDRNLVGHTKTTEFGFEQGPRLGLKSK
jgi:hypothetical protein